MMNHCRSDKKYFWITVYFLDSKKGIKLTVFALEFIAIISIEFDDYFAINPYSF